MKLEKTIMVPKTITVDYVVFDGKTIPEYRKNQWDNAFIKDEVLNLELESYHNGDISTREVIKGGVLTNTGRIFKSEEEFLKWFDSLT